MRAEADVMDTALADKRYTYADYAGWDEDVRCELIDGELFMMATPTVEHQRISMALTALIGTFLRGKTCMVFPAPLAVRLNAGTLDDTVVEPDIMVVCDRSKLDKNSIIGAPDMVVEILSPSTADYDVLKKLLLYRRAGVREYWIINPEAKAVSAHILQDNGYLLNVYSDDDTVPVHVLDGLEIRLRDIFE
jgi:Uma2 family endonuclease